MWIYETNEDQLLYLYNKVNGNINNGNIKPLKRYENKKNNINNNNNKFLNKLSNMYFFPLYN